MRRFLVRRLFLFMLPAIAGCGLTDVLEPDALEDEPEVREFEEHLTSVDLDGNSVTLYDGTVVKVGDDTERKPDEQGRLYDLESLHHALEDGLVATAWGEGEVESDDPPTLMASYVGFTVEHTEMEFEDDVTSVDLAGHSLVLEDGTKVVLTEHTVMKENDGVVYDLEDAAAALENDQRVVAWGKGEVDPGNEDVVAMWIGFEIEMPVIEEPPVEQPVFADFEGVVAQVFLPYNNLILADGTTVTMVDETEMVTPDGEPIDLATIAEALENDLEVVAWGTGLVQFTDPVVFLAALSVTVRIEEEEPEPPTTPAFEGIVDFVDFFGNELLLRTDAGDITVQLTGTTTITAANDFSPSDLSALENAVFAGHRVIARGTGPVDPTNPNVFTAETLELETASEEFDADVQSVNGRIGFVLEDGRNVWLTGVTEVTPADPTSPSNLTGIQDALDAGDRVRATGIGIVMDFQPGTLEAVRVTLQRLPAS